MFRNYIKIALRNLKKQKLYSFINIAGLAVGIAFCFLVLLFINDELKYDTFHENKEDIYRLYRQPLVDDIPYDLDLYTPMPLGEAMLNDIPEVENFTRLAPFGSMVIRNDGQLIDQSGFAFADPGIFEMFSFPLKYGDPSSALSNPNTLVIDESIAEKYFNGVNPVGRFLDVRLNGEFKKMEISGVIENIPDNSSFRFNILLSVQTVINNFENYASVENQWDATRSLTFVQLNSQAILKTVQAKLPSFISKYMGNIFDELRNDGRYDSDGPPIIYNLQPLMDIHLNPDFPSAFSNPSNPLYSFILGGIGLAVLLIACFNFMILAVGRSAKRVKEVGLRKVVGAQKNQLMLQFWGEAFVLTFIAFLVGVFLAEFSLPLFNQLSGKDLVLFDLASSIPFLIGLIMLFLVTGFIAGSYPSLILSNFKPIESLKEKLNFKGSNRFTKSLIVVQFTLTIFLIIATIIMSSQLNFLQEKNLGFSGEQVVVVPTSGLDGERVIDLYRNTLGNEQDILEVTGANVSFSSGLWRRGYLYEGEVMQSAVFRVDHNYINTLEMNLVAGRDFDPLLSSDSTASIIVNESFIRTHGLELSDIGNSFPIDWGWMVNPKIIGVVQDFNYQSLNNTVEPVMIYMNPRDPILNMMVRVSPENIPKTVNKLKENWTNVTSDVPFSYSFLDEDMDNLYRSEQRWSKIVSYSSLLAIVIACLGLFGLAGIVAVQRQKEIGIRKVLGATTTSITLMLSSDFAKLVLVSIGLASPIAWYIMSQWLKEFAYQIDISIWIFITAGIIALLVSILTVGFKSIKAALSNPIESLKSE
jgi:putative ABC transport system permease protein